MRIGNLRETLELQAPDHQADSNAGQLDRWATRGTLSAEVVPTGGNRVLEGGTMQGVQGWKVTLRWRRDLTAQDATSHRFLWNGRPLVIRSIADPDGRRAALVAFCETGVPT